MSRLMLPGIWDFPEGPGAIINEHLAPRNQSVLQAISGG